MLSHRYGLKTRNVFERMNLPKSQCPHLYNADKNNTDTQGLVRIQQDNDNEELIIVPGTKWELGKF